MRDVVVALALRTPGGRAKKGTFRQTRPDDLGAAVIRALLRNAPNLDPARIGDVVFGCAMPEGEQGLNVGRNMVLLAGLPDRVITRAKALLAELEDAGQTQTDVRDAAQLGLFAPPVQDPIAAELAALDLAHLTPLEALNLLHKWQQRAGRVGPPEGHEAP